MRTVPRAKDSQLVELAGRNWLASQLQHSGIEVARPERDRGVDLIAYIDLDKRLGKFTACPIQMKAATETVFSLHPKYKRFPNLILAYVWHLGNPSKTVCFALTYSEALDVATRMRFTKTNSWRIGGRHRRRGYTTTKPSTKLRNLLAQYHMDDASWWKMISRS